MAVRGLRLRLAHPPSSGIGRAVRLGDEDHRRLGFIVAGLRLPDGVAAVGDPQRARELELDETEEAQGPTTRRRGRPRRDCRPASCPSSREANTWTDRSEPSGCRSSRSDRSSVPIARASSSCTNCLFRARGRARGGPVADVHVVVRGRTSRRMDLRSSISEITSSGSIVPWSSSSVPARAPRRRCPGPGCREPGCR